MRWVPRQAGPSDVDAAIGVWRRANEARGVHHPPEVTDRVLQTLTHPAGVFVVVEEAGTIVGMAAGEPGRADRGAGPEVSGLFHLNVVFVDAGHWGQGIGAVVLDALLAAVRAAGYTRIQLWTGAGNERARRLYGSRGFAPSGDTDVLDSHGEILQYARDL